MSQEGRTYNKLSYEQQNKLISLVYDNAHIYDNTAENYGNKTLLKNTWQRIAEEMGVNGLDHEQCRLKWKNMRDYFNAICKKIKEAVKDGSKIPYQGNLYKRLTFLADHISNGKANDGSNDGVENEEGFDHVIDEKIRSVLWHHSMPKEPQSEPQRKKNRRSASHLSSSVFGETSSEQTVQTNNVGMTVQTMDILWERMRSDYERLLEKQKGLEAELEEKKNQLKDKEKQTGNQNAFYLMMADKMSKYPLSDQVWMENQIWNLYMNLAVKIKEPDNNTDPNNSSPNTSNAMFYTTLS